ncbi:Malic acid transport protein [Exophiala dermatitidis]
MSRINGRINANENEQNNLNNGNMIVIERDGTSDPPPPFVEAGLQRLRHLTWAWFTFPMATGGIALLLSPQNQPHSFRGLETIGTIIYIFDLCIFILTVAAITYRFSKWPHALISSLVHPTESLYFGTAFLAMASIIACMAHYGIPHCGPWLVVVYRVLFWIYVSTTFVVAVGAYSMLFTNPRLKIQDMTPAWDLPMFPFMLSGTIASSGIEFQPRQHAMPMLFAGLTAQGLGMCVSCFMYASYARRMIQYGFPSPESRPGMFIAVGPPSFTTLAIIGLADHWPGGYDYFGPDAITAQVVRVLALMTAVFIWSLSLWFFSISVVSCLAVWKTFRFRMNWWAFVFPNVGFTLATINIGKSLQSQAVMWVGSVMTACLIIVYLYVLCNFVRAVWRKDVLYAGKDEDNYKREKMGKAEALGDDVERNIGNRDVKVS